MKKLFLVLICIPFLGLSQNDSITEKSEFKHEIGTNIAPLLVELMSPGNKQEEANFTLMYKYHFSDKWALRFIPSSTKLRKGWSLFGEKSYVETLIYEFEKIEQKWETEIFHQESRPQINLGVEKKQQLAKNTSLFYGLDFVYAYHRKHHLIYEEIRPYDSLNLRYKHSIDRENLYEASFYSHYIGLSPFVGLKYSFNKHFCLSGNFNVILVKSFTRKESTNYRNSTRVPQKEFKYYDGFDGWNYGIISDLSISYRF